MKVSAKMWDFQECDGTDSGVQLVNIGVMLAIADIDDRVDFALEARES